MYCLRTGKRLAQTANFKRCKFETLKGTEYIPRYTYSDYVEWQGEWELINGYPYAMSPAPLNQHQILGKNFLYEIEFQLRNNRKDGCNCTVQYVSNWIISDQNVVKPDIAVMCTKVDLKGFIRTPPVLIVEILSASTRMKDRNTKFNMYQDCGVKFYLMADPDTKKVEIFKLVDNIYREMPDKGIFNLTKDCMIALDYTALFVDL